MKKLLIFLFIIYLPHISVAQTAGYEGKRLNAGVDLSFINCLIFSNKNYTHGFTSLVGGPSFYLGYALTDKLNLKMGYGFEKSAITDNVLQNLNNNGQFQTHLTYLDDFGNEQEIYAYFKNYKIDINSNIVSINLEYYHKLNIPLVSGYWNFGYEHYTAKLTYDPNDFYQYVDTNNIYYNSGKGTPIIPGTESFGTIKKIHSNFFIIGGGVKRVIKGRVILDFGLNMGLQFFYYTFSPSHITNDLSALEVKNENKTIISKNYTAKNLNDWENDFIKKSVKARLRAQNVFRLKFGVGFLID